MSTVTDIVLLAHGSPDPRHAKGVETLAHRVRTLAPHRPVHTAYLDHHAPSPRQTAAGIGRHAVVVPVLLTPAYHAKVDVPAAVNQMIADSGSLVGVAAGPRTAPPPARRGRGAARGRGHQAPPLHRRGPVCRRVQ